MPFLTDEDVEERLKSPDNLVNSLKVIELRRGRTEGATEVPLEIKKTLCILANEKDTTQKELGSAFGLSQMSVSLFERGLADVPGRPNEELQDTVKNVRAGLKTKREKAEGQAIDILVDSLQLVNAQIGEVTKPKILSSIAKDMAIISEKMRPVEERGTENQVHVHLYAPRLKEVSEYEVIDVAS